MPSATIKFDDREIPLGPGRVTIGRTADNTVSFPSDSNVSRYHARIESSGEDFLISDLGSSNGTTVNGSPVTAETALSDGDVVAFGGSSQLTFEMKKEDSGSSTGTGAMAGGSGFGGDSSESHDPSPEAAMAATNDEEVAGGSKKMLMVAGGTCLVAVIAVAAAGAFYFTRGSSCAPKASISSPEPADIIYDATEIVLDLRDGACVQSASYMIDGQEFARTDESPYSATFDPKEFAELSDGSEHTISVLLRDQDGSVVADQPSVRIALETRRSEKPTAPQPPTGGGPQQPTLPTGKAISLIDIQAMAQQFVKQLPGNFPYNISNKQFLEEVQKKTAEYAQDGFYAKAEPFADTINISFHRDNGVPAQFGYLTAFSRSKFVPAKNGVNEGLWQMSNDFAASNGYIGQCGTETIADAKQACAAKAAALYAKFLVYSVFDGDLVYSAAAFGRSPQDAAAWKSTLPANRFDLWNSIKTAPEREQLIRFFAAGIVAENPQKFGLAKDQPLSVLYRVTM